MVSRTCGRLRPTAAVGERVIAGEAELDRLFGSFKITPEDLDAAGMRIAAAQGELRAAHLRYHLQTKTHRAGHHICAATRL